MPLRSTGKTLFELYGGDRVKYWLTINEQNMMILHGDAIGTKSVTTENPEKDLYQQNHHMLLAQAKAMKACHEILPHAKIGRHQIFLRSIRLLPNRKMCWRPATVLRFVTGCIWIWRCRRYNNIAWAFLEERNATPDIQEGDMEIMASARRQFHRI